MVPISLISLCALLPAVVFGCCGGPSGAQDPFDPLGPWHARNLNCGPPPFMHRLPLDVQAKIRAVWANYKDGDECLKQREETREIVQAIPDEQRHKIFHGMCGPAFLKDASNTVRNEFKRIWFDEKLTLDEKSSEFQKLAYSTLNGEALEKFNLFEKELKERKQAREQRINSLSPAAREAYDKWNGLRKQERLYLAGLPQDVRAELRLVCAYCGTHKFGHDRRRSAGFSPRTAHADAVEVDAMLRRSVRDVLSQAAGECAQVF